MSDTTPTIYTTGTGKAFTLQTTPECEPHATIEDWLAYGERMGWVSAMYCGGHDYPPYTPEEDQQAEEYGEAPCTWHVRVWVDGRPIHVEGGREGW